MKQLDKTIALLAVTLSLLVACTNDIGSVPTGNHPNAVNSIGVAIHTEANSPADYQHNFSFTIKSVNGTVFDNSIVSCSNNFCNLATNLPFHYGKESGNLYSITAYDNGGFIGFGGLRATSSQKYVAIDSEPTQMYLDEHPEIGTLGPISNTSGLGLDMAMSSTACSIIKSGTKVVGEIGKFSATAKGVSAGLNIFGDVFGTIFNPCKSNFNSTVLTDLSSIIAGESQIESQLDGISQQITLIEQQDQLITAMLSDMNSILNSANEITDQLIISSAKVQLQTYSSSLEGDANSINNIGDYISTQCKNVAMISNFDLENTQQLTDCLDNYDARLNIERLLDPQQLNGCTLDSSNCIASNLNKISPMFFGDKSSSGDLQTLLIANYQYIGTDLLTQSLYSSVWSESGPYALNNYVNSLVMLKVSQALFAYNAYQQLGGYILLKYPQDPLTAQYSNPGDSADQVAINFAASFSPIENGTESSVYQYYSTNHGDGSNYYKVAANLETDLGGALPITKNNNASQCQMTDYNNSATNPTVYYQCDNTGNSHLPLYLNHCANNNPISSTISGNTINTNVYYSNSGTGGYLVCDDTFVGTSVGATMGSSAEKAMFNVEYPHPSCTSETTENGNTILCDENSVINGDTLQLTSQNFDLLAQTPGNGGQLSSANGILQDSNSNTSSFSGLVQLNNGGIVDYIHNYLGTNSGSSSNGGVKSGVGNVAEIWMRCPLGNISGCRSGSFSVQPTDAAGVGQLQIAGNGGAIMADNIYSPNITNNLNGRIFTIFNPASTQNNLAVENANTTYDWETTQYWTPGCIQYGDNQSIDCSSNETISNELIGFNLESPNEHPDFTRILPQFESPTTIFSALNNNLEQNDASAPSGEFGNVVMMPGFTLTTGQAIRTYVNASSTGNGLADVYELYLNESGALVEYQCTDIECKQGFPIWGTQTTGGVRATLQTDGNFVLYNSSNQGIWGSNTYAGGTNTTYMGTIPAPTAGGNQLVLQIDGNLVVYQNPQESPDPLLNNGTAVWNNQMSVTNLNNNSSYANGWRPPQGYGG